MHGPTRTFSANLRPFSLQLATLLMNPGEGAIIQMYSRGTNGIFEVSQMAAFVMVYFLTTCVVYGIGVSTRSPLRPVHSNLLA